MGRRRQPPIRGRMRTRDHIIADLAVNYVERQVLLGGHTIQEITSDYGLDMILFPHLPSGEVGNGYLFLQVKATDRPTRLAGGGHITVSVDRANLIHWVNEDTPVVLVVYDGVGDVAWWLHVQGYFQALPGFNIFRAGKTVRVRIPSSQVVNAEAIRELVGLIGRARSGRRP